MNILFSSAAMLISGIAMFFSGVFAPPLEAPDYSQFATKGEVSSVRNDIFNLEDTVAQQKLESQNNLNLGATNAVPSVVALFETSLASSISSSATSFTLTSATDLVGTTLASSTYGFIIDEGTASQEMVLADCTGTVCTNATRGLSPVSGTTTVASLQKSHRRGASVKITDGPILNIISRIVNGVGTFPNKVRYTSHPTFTVDTEFVDKKYVDDTAFSGAAVVDGSATARGVLELATQLETASSTAVGGSGNLAIAASSATSTYNSATAALRVVVTQNNGKIDNSFIATSTLLTNISLATSTYIGAFPAWEIGKQRQVFTSTGTTTFAIPSGVTKIYVEVQAAGSGGGVGSDGSPDGAGGGGGGGGYSNEVIDVSATTTAIVYVGANGIYSQFTNASGAPYLRATTGVGGTNDGTGGAGGCGSGGDVNICGSGGGGGSGAGATNNINASGHGGASHLGGGAPGVTGSDTVGIDGANYGGGGSGGVGDSAGNGAQGIVIVRW